MITGVTFVRKEGTSCKVFIADQENGYSVKGILTVQGEYSNLVGLTGASLHLEKLIGSIGDYQTTMFGLVVEGVSNILDITDNIGHLLTVPDTAAKVLLNSMSEDMKDLLQEAVESLRYYEGISEASKLTLPNEVFDRLPAESANKMKSVRKSYILRSTDNQEIFQKGCNEEYGVLLPSVEDIHSGANTDVSPVDILRVIAPYRKEERPGHFSYKAVYHTPYYKVLPQIRGFVPQHLSWLAGHSVNNTRDIQPFEKHMANNLKNLICSDLSRYVSEIVSGIFFDTLFGATLSKLCDKRPQEVLNSLLSDLREYNSEDVSCEIPFSDVEELLRNGWVQSEVASTVKRYLNMKPGFLRSLVTQRPRDRRVIMCDNLPFTLNIADSEEQEFTELLIEGNFISSAMHDFLLNLCQAAYCTNWGHTGAARTIPGFAFRSNMDAVSQYIAKYLDNVFNKGDTSSVAHPNMYVKNFANTDTTDDDIVIYEGGDGGEDEITRAFDYYITAETEFKIENNSLESEFFTTPPSAASSSEAGVVEYWRIVNGGSNLENFLSSAFLRTANSDIFIEAFIKLMRWGSNKPQLLVLQNNPEVRDVFDLNTGKIEDNISIVDESELVKHNGCDYSLAGFLMTDSNPVVQPSMIIGFLLEKDYGKVRKNYLASWLDMAEMFSDDASVNVAEFATVTKVNMDPSSFVAIETFATKDGNLYVSDSNIKEGLKLEIPAKDLSALALLTTAGVTGSVEYIRSLKNEHIITLRDRQYDILRRYFAAVSQFYNLCGGMVNKASTTLELSGLITQFSKIYSSGTESKQDANEARAHAALKSIDLEGSSAEPSSVDWDTTPLEGKFYLIHDTGMKAALVPIEFTDPNVRKVAMKLRNRVVLLLLQTSDKCILCRKDIKESEVKIISKAKPDGSKALTLGNFPFEKLEGVFTNLQKGVACTISGMPAVLHESLRDVL